jgi:hypothetical protein
VTLQTLILPILIPDLIRNLYTKILNVAYTALVRRYCRKHAK